uniref:hypothetical protein n=1 Tax=Brucella pseudintermedia TaxID=370111 RepID=UPI001F27B394
TANHRVRYQYPTANPFRQTGAACRLRPTYSAFSEGLDGGFDADGQAMAKPLPVLYATRLEDALAAVTDAGGTIVKPIFSFPGGRRFHFTDPAGNELAIWSDQ